MRSVAIAIAGLSVRLGAEQVLRDVSLEVVEGSYTGIVGPNGGGKTTLLRVLLGLQSVHAGTVHVYGRTPSDACRQGWIGYVPQRIAQAGFQFPSTVREVVMSGTLRLRRTERRERAMEALCEVGMESLAEHAIDTLSGGQRQRVFIARALAGRPRILLLDEPTTGVDPAAREQFYALLRRLNREQNATIVFVSHDLEVMTKEASHVCCLNQALLCCCSAHTFLEDARMQQLYGQNVSLLSHTH